MDVNISCWPLILGKPKKQKLELPQRKSTRLRGLPAPEMQIETDKENHVLITGAEEPVSNVVIGLPIVEALC
jgi:hypothetical protein